MKKSKSIIFIIFLVFTISVIVFYIRFNDKTEKSKNDINKNSWAIDNSGQEIEGSIGVQGIDINIMKAWKITKGSDKIIIGVVDTGVDMNSGNLMNNLWNNRGEVSNNGIDDDKNGYVDDYNGWDFYNNDNSIYDDYLYDYHGTYISNTILDIAPKVKILSSKFLKGTEGDAYDSIKAVQYAIDNGAKIINCSWCFEKNEEELYQLIKDNSDVLFVCAAGNFRLNLDETFVYPACYNLDNVISVMAIDNAGEIYDVSGYGLNVDLAAPGKDIYVTLPENDQTFVSGTSIATAFVTGTAALMKSMNNELSPEEIKNIMNKTTKKLSSLKEKCKSECLQCNLCM